MIRCAMCGNSLKTKRLGCDCCGVAMEGDFSFPRLLRLSAEHLALAEAFLLCGGNLKDLSATLEVSYPTLRKRLDDLIAQLQNLKKQDEEKIGQILSQIEKKEIVPEAGIKKIKEINGEL